MVMEMLKSVTAYCSIPFRTVTHSGNVCACVHEKMHVCVWMQARVEEHVSQMPSENWNSSYFTLLQKVSYFTKKSATSLKNNYMLFFGECPEGIILL